MLENAIGALNSSGVFVGNLDLDNNVVEETRSVSHLKNLFNQNGLQYNARTKVLSRTGGKVINFDLKYLGADDSIGPNYTGQDAVASYYM